MNKKTYLNEFKKQQNLAVFTNFWDSPRIQGDVYNTDFLILFQSDCCQLTSIPMVSRLSDGVRPSVHNA